MSPPAGRRPGPHPGAGGVRSHPRPRILGQVRRIFHHQMRRSGVPVDIRMRQPALQVAEEPLREDGVACAPQQQVGTVRRSVSPKATRSSAARLGWPDSRGMSATNSAMACRREEEEYGASSALRTSAGICGQDIAAAARTKVVVRTQTSFRSMRLRASRISAGVSVLGGTETPVLVKINPVICSRWRCAQPSEMGPPQSCAASTTCPVISSSDVMASRSSIRRQECEAR